MKVSCGVAFVSTEPSPRLLLLLRAPNTGNERTWGLPGGQREPNEKLKPLFATAQRECGEEIGITPLVYSGVFTMQRPGNKVYHVFCFVTRAPEDMHVCLLDGEHTDSKWVELSDMCAPLHPVVDALLAKHVNDLRMCASASS